MRNYIILNNKSSNDINGLIIQELAPISKPQQRTQVETIDGRDGDIVTPLGYAAYNKKIKIGLYGDFDINEIIAYFATQGTAIFSNEPDKYYNYQIVDQIDYERLVRFRVATVTMHVQPFKYSATEGTITVDSSDTVSDEGSDIALDGTAEAPFNVLRHKGNAIQDGTPTPDSPIDVKVLTGDSMVKITGKNLAWSGWAEDFVNRVDNSARAKIETFDGKNCVWWRENTGYGDYDNKYIFKTDFQPNTQYTLSCDLFPTREFALMSIKYTDGTGQRLEDITPNQWNHVVVTSTAGKTIKYIQVAYFEGNVYCDIDTFQLELGSTATAYEPYQGQSYVIPFGDTYLAAIGDYADEPVKVGDTWYIRRAIGKVVLDGTEEWLVISSISNDSTWLLQRITAQSDAESVIATSNNYLYSDLFSIYNCFGASNTNEGLCYHQDKKMMVRLLKSRLGDTNIASLFRAWLSTHNTTVYYRLATPTDEEITDQALIDALDDFYEQAHGYKGRTHITANAQGDNAPAVLSVEVGENNESTVTNAGNTTSRPIITIYGQGNIGMYINDVQVLDIALGDEQYITIDSVAMEAYKDTTENLKNRLVTGDYNKLALNAGANKIYFTGNVTKYEISKYSRWL